MSVISIRGVPTFHDDAGGGPEVGAGDLAGDSGPDRPGADLTTESVTTAYVMDASSLRGLMRRSPVVVDLLRERVRQLTAVSR